MKYFTLSEIIDRLVQYIIEKTTNSKGTAISFSCPEFVEYLKKQYNINEKIPMPSICTLVHRLMEMTEQVGIIHRRKRYVYIIQKKKLGKIIETLIAIKNK